MIAQNSDRTFSFGASDTNFFFMGYDTKTFQNWWDSKTGASSIFNFSNKYTAAGNAFEIPIICEIEKLTNRHVNIGVEPFTCKEFPRLKVNYDGYTEDTTIEVKTVRWDIMLKWVAEGIPENYWRQTQVEMLVKGHKKAELWAYALFDEDYEFLNQIMPVIDPRRLKKYNIQFDKNWVDGEYTPRLLYLSNCMDVCKTPSETDFKEWRK